MNALELLELIQQGESSRVQFKEMINNINQLSQEFSALSNTEGSLILIGISDKGEIKGLSAEQIHKLNQWISNAASQHVKPPISPITEVVTIEKQHVVVVKLSAGYAKPYYTNEGIAYVKMGADKRIAPPEEILRLFQTAGKIYADEAAVPGSSVDDIDQESCKKFIINKFRDKYSELSTRELLKKSLDELVQYIDENMTLGQLLTNMKLCEGNTLTLAGLLLLGAHPQKYKPLFSIKCVSFIGDEISANGFRDKEDLFDGNLFIQYSKAMNFVIRNLRQVQKKGESFNSLGELEISKDALQEIITNSLVHRDYYIASSIQVFVFDSRLEIISPGKLTNTLDENNIRYYTSIARNPVIYSNSAFAGLPFTGIGSGIPRAINLHPDIKLTNDKTNNRFVVTIRRPRV